MSRTIEGTWSGSTGEDRLRHRRDLDLLLDRPPFAEAAVRLFSLAETGAVEGFGCATSVTTVYYLADRAVGRGRARALVQRLLGILDIAPVNRAVLASALGARLADVEDAAVAEAGRSAGVDAVVTRNARDYKRAGIMVYAPDDLLRALRASEGGE